MKDDMISRQAALKACRNPEYGENCYAYGDDIEKRLKSLPPAQPEIIRCKDCRHNHNCDIQYHAQAGDMFFCAGAERRTDE